MFWYTGILGCCSERDLVHGVEHRPDTLCSCLVSRMFVFHTYLEDVPIEQYLLADSKRS